MNQARKPRWCKLHWEFELALDAVPTNYFACEWLVIKGDAIVDKTAENHRNTALALKYRTFVFFEKLTNIFDIFTYVTRKEIQRRKFAE